MTINKPLSWKVNDVFLMLSDWEKKWEFICSSFI